MALYDRLMGLAAPKIPVHQFMAAMGEWERGKLTRAQVIAAFDIEAGEEADLDSLAARVKPDRESYCLCGRVTLTNVGTAVDANVDSQSLPFVYIEKNGITRIDLEVRNRIAATQTGDVDYILHNDTDGNDALSSANATGGSLTDTAAAGDHTLNAHRIFAAPLTPGVVKLRLQAKSTVAADDPTFLGAALLVTRADRMSSMELHEVLCLAEHGVAEYDTVAEVKARLGVS